MVSVSDIIIFAYLSSAIAFLLLSIFLIVSWRGKIQGALLCLAAFNSALWAGIVSYQASQTVIYSTWIMVLEHIRGSSWLAFLFTILMIGTVNKSAYRFLSIFSVSVALFLILFLLFIVFAGPQDILEANFTDTKILFYGYLLLSIVGLILIEQIFRNTRIEQRWAIKFLSVGIGGMFAYDLYLYANALLFNQINLELWGARGFVNTLVVPLIIISAARNQDWSLDVYISRRFAFHTTTLFAVGLYLIAMAAGGYFIQVYGGDWSRVVQVAFVFGAVLVLVMLLFSGRVRARLRIFLSQHLYNYRYDYRDEWLKIIGTLSQEQGSKELKLNAIRSLADIVESPGGALWFKNKFGDYEQVSNWNMANMPFEIVNQSSPLVQFFNKWHLAINTYELETTPDLYKGVELPDWIALLKHLWLIIPLMHQTKLLGFVMLAQPRVNIKNINWEDRDLLITAGKQVASYLALSEASAELYNSRQFDAFNRLSAFVVHDLKNIAAQLTLITKNAVRHKEDPVFIDDVVVTVDNATKKMNRLLDQLRHGREPTQKVKRTKLDKAIAEVLTKRASDIPVPEIESKNTNLEVVADTDRLIAVLAHLVQNAQEATESSGFVKLRSYEEDNYGVIEIEDNGCGMEDEFIRERLFKPFETTKGNAGMGIGVYEAKEFINSIGGNLSVNSKPGVGTTFKLKFVLTNNSQSGYIDNNQINQAS